MWPADRVPSPVAKGLRDKCRLQFVLALVPRPSSLQTACPGDVRAEPGHRSRSLTQAVERAPVVV